MCRVPNSARMLLPAEAHPQLRPTPLEQGRGGGIMRGWRHGRKRRRAEVRNSTGEKGDFKLPSRLTACGRAVSPDWWTQLPPSTPTELGGCELHEHLKQPRFHLIFYTRSRNRIQEKHEFKTALRTMQSGWVPLPWGPRMSSVKHHVGGLWMWRRSRGYIRSAQLQ